MAVAWNDISDKANGGTEMMCRRLEKDLPEDLLKNFQIIPSRVRELDASKIRLLYLHDLPSDPESEHLKNQGWENFHRLIFVSYWQRDWYMRQFKIPASKCIVLQNAIHPIQVDKPTDKVNVIYHTTPHRGLELLVPVFKALAEKHKDVHLDVFSSFNAYGWGERDKPYEKLFEEIKNHASMTYHGYQPNDVVREYLGKAHVFAYPSIWMETSCIALMEAMSAQAICVHPDYGALPETAANWTVMYNWHEDPNKHAGTFFNVLNIAIELAREADENNLIKLKGQKSYVDLFYNWDVKKLQWKALLESLLQEPRDLPKKNLFVYNV